MREQYRNHGRAGNLVLRIAVFAVVSLVLAITMLVLPAASSAGMVVGVSVTYAPPALPIYVQPPCPGPGFIWIPGYWAWDPDIGYYWVPGTWVLAPFVGALWTPGYWDWDDGVFVWVDGYWGPVVGFYGGIDYGFGYTGYGYVGGYWSGGRFYYNRAVNNVSVTNITTVYNRPVTGPVTRTRVSYNGGPGGVTHRPTSEQSAAARQRRATFTDAQRQNQRAALTDPRQRAAVNNGRPAVAATPKPGEFKGHGVVRASRAGAPYKAPPASAVKPGAPARTPHPSRGVEERPRATAPERGAPPARSERNVAPHSVAPRTEPSRREYRPAPAAPRPAPERPAMTRPPVTPRAAPERPARPAPSEGNRGNMRQEEGGPQR